MSYRNNSERAKDFQEPPSEATVLFFYKEMQRGTEESARPSDGLCHHQA